MYYWSIQYGYILRNYGQLSDHIEPLVLTLQHLLSSRFVLLLDVCFLCNDLRFEFDLLICQLLIQLPQTFSVLLQLNVMWLLGIEFLQEAIVIASQCAT